MKLLLAAFVVLGLVIDGVDLFFNNPLTYTCEIQKSNNVSVACYAACPLGTNVESQYSCANGKTCCRGTPVCVGINCNNGTCNINATCDCEPGFSPSDNCLAYACENNGHCVNGTCNPLSDPELYNCTCQDGFSGYNCTVDACLPDPCVNGTCQREPMGQFFCNCTDPNIGEYCNETICTDNPCMNGGTCTPLTATTYNCACATNFTGDNCTEAVCSGTDIECSYNGTCVPDAVHPNYTCNCDPGFTGAICNETEPICGIEIETYDPLARILHGIPDVEHKHPFLVRMNHGGTTYCNAGLVSPNWVITTATCASICNESGIMCNATLGDYNTTFVEEQERTVGINRIVYHPGTNATTMDFVYAQNTSALYEKMMVDNLALLELAEPAVQNKGVNWACSAQGYDFIRVPNNNVSLTIAAFGSNNQSVLSFGDVRTMRNAITADDAMCQTNRGNLVTPNNTHCGFIVGTLGGTCFGDSGGIVMGNIPNSNPVQYSLEGIILFRPAAEYHPNYTLCSNNYFLYTSLENYQTWITDTITV